MGKPNVWTVAKLRRLKELKENGAIGSDIAKELDKTVQQVHNKWLYIKANGFERALARADDYQANGAGRPSKSAIAKLLDMDPVVTFSRDPGEVMESAMITPTFTRDQLKLAIHFVAGVGDVEQSITLLRRLSEIAV